MLLFLIPLFLHSTFAQTTASETCTATALGKTLVGLETQSLNPLQPTVQNWLQPVLDEAKAFSESYSVPSGLDEAKALQDETLQFHLKIKKSLKKLEKEGCISRVTFLTQRRMLELTSFVQIFRVAIDPEVTHLSNPSTFLFNQNEYEIMASRLSPEKFLAWKTARDELDQSFPTQKSPIGKLSASEFLLLNYARTDINLLSNLFLETLTLMSANSSSMTVSSPITHQEVQVTFSPTDLAHLSIRYFERGIDRLNLTSSFSRKKVGKAEAVMAAFYSGDVDADSVLVLLKNKSIREPRNDFLKRLARLTWNAAQAVLYQVPITIPFITFGTILYDAIQSAKAMERSQADAAHLIPSR